MPAPIRVAIVGGGICGCTLANGLLRYPHIDWHLYEGKPALIERGAAVGFRVNATKALAAMGLQPEEMYKNTSTVVSDSSRCIIALGEHKGKPIIELPAGHLSVVRNDWLNELLKALPKDRLHVNKKLASVDYVAASGTETHATYRLHFQDGTTSAADAVVGCDGVRSLLRKLILEEQYPDTVAPRFGGYWDARGQTTPQIAAERFGKELFDPLKSDEIALTGEGTFMLFCPSEDGTRYSVIVSAAATPEYDQTAWKATLTREFLQNSYQTWDENFRDAVIDCMMAEDSGPGVVFSQWETSETPTYYRNGLCIVGDAAHSMLPYMGYGAGMATEDAAVMSALLGECRSPVDIPAAFQAFDSTRRGRNEDLLKTARRAAKLMTGQFGLDPDYIATLNPSKWWTEIMDINMEEHVQDAINKLSQFRSY